MAKSTKIPEVSRPLAERVHERIDALDPETMRGILQTIATYALDWRDSAEGGRWYDGATLAGDERRMLRTIANALLRAMGGQPEGIAR